MTAGPEFLAPTDLHTAVELAADDETLVVSGGTALALLLRERLVEPDRLLWLGRVAEINGITETDQGLRIGATTTLWDLAGDPAVRRRSPMIASAARSVGNPRVRAVASIGGAIAHADPRQDLLPALLAADARVTLVGRSGRREVALADGFFRGFLDTELDDELIEAVDVPATEDSSEVYVRFTPTSDGDYPTVAVAARSRWDGDGSGRLSLALGGVASTPVLAWTSADGPVSFANGGIAALLERVDEVVDPTDDPRGSPEYKRAMARLWAERAVRATSDHGC